MIDGIGLGKEGYSLGKSEGWDGYLPDEGCDL